MRKETMMNNAPKAQVRDMHEHSDRSPDAILAVTRTEHIPLIFGSGDQTPGQIIDGMLREGHVSKISLDLEKDNW